MPRLETLSARGGGIADEEVPVQAAGLHEFVDALQVRLNLVGDGIHESFFAGPAAETSPRSAARAGA